MKNKLLLAGVGIFTLLLLTSCAPIFEELTAEIPPVTNNGSTTEPIGTSTSPVGTTTIPTIEGTTSPIDSLTPAGSSTPNAELSELGSTSTKL